jgi:asparagine synthase (glutamine-hydrolysing)
MRRREATRDDESVLRRQIATIRYRGPDAAGIWVGRGVGLGHARLSIIDVSDAANQPMLDREGGVVIAFNGEIYNFAALRSELEALGHRFRTRSDTEVILEGYKAWGIAAVERLRGMFAIALYDGASDTLWLARDRVGKKPLYYSECGDAECGDTVVFGSEIKAVLAFPGVARTPDYDAIHEYLTFQYVPSPMTAFTGVAKLPPGHIACVRRGAAPTLRRYHKLPEPTAARAVDPKKLETELVAQLEEATRLRMVSDVPLGAFLSGGVDSSAVVATMARLSAEPVRTFTIGFDEQAYDERPYARMVAERYGTVHTEMTVRPDALAILPELVYHYGEPYADSSAIPTYYVSKIAREHVTVILSGDGGDENFLGYTRYRSCREKDARVTSRTAMQLERLVRAVPAGWDRFGAVRRARRYAAALHPRRSRAYEQFVAYFSDESKAALYRGEMRKYLARSALDRLDQYFDAAQTMAMGACWADVHTYLPDDLLVKIDVASMANSLEVRAPFLDQELMRWAAGIPEAQRFDADEPKSLLKRAMEPYLPKSLLYRPKMGFGVPIDQWLRTDLRDHAFDVLLSEQARSRGLFEPAEIESILRRHLAGENWAIRIWALLMLELWFVEWIDPVDAFDRRAARSVMARYDDVCQKVA